MELERVQRAPVTPSVDGSFGLAIRLPGQAAVRPAPTYPASPVRLRR